MDLEVVTDTGVADAVRELAGELREVSGDFADATVAVAGELLAGLRCLPEAGAPRPRHRHDEGAVVTHPARHRATPHRRC